MHDVAQVAQRSAGVVRARRGGGRRGGARQHVALQRDVMVA